MATQENWEAPPEKDFDDKESLQWWLMYTHCHDQYVIRHDNMTEVMWCRKADSMTCESRANWSDRYVAWSPKGTFLATFHRQGIILHGGKRWQRIGRFAHPNVTVIDFSPNENYLVTWSNDAPADAQSGQAVVVWDIKSGARLRKCPMRFDGVGVCRASGLLFGNCWGFNLHKISTGSDLCSWHMGDVIFFWKSPTYMIFLVLELLWQSDCKKWRSQNTWIVMDEVNVCTCIYRGLRSRQGAGMARAQVEPWWQLCC